MDRTTRKRGALQPLSGNLTAAQTQQPTAQQKQQVGSAIKAAAAAAAPAAKRSRPTTSATGQENDASASRIGKGSSVHRAFSLMHAIVQPAG